MTIPYKVIIGEKISRSKQKQVQLILDEVFEEANITFNHWNPSSEISFINQSKAGSFPCSDELMQLFQFANNLVHLSHYRFDPSIGLAINCWKESLPEGRFVDQRTIDSWKDMIGWKHLKIKENTIIKERDNLYFDFDSISKGLVVDKIIKKLKDIGIKSAYVEWGGEISVIGNNRLNEPWKIGILNPFNPSHTIDVLHLTDKAIATSGNYIQKWCVEDKEYTHLIDGKNLIPLEVSPYNISSATVIAPTCILADGLATIACLFDNPQDLEHWMQMVKQTNKDVDFIIIYQNNNP
jgi:thiamine biosynthesis lipoprotein